MKLRLLGVVGLLLVGVLAVVIAVFGPALGSSNATQYVTSRATVTDVVKDVVASGTLAAQTTYGLNFGSDPRIVSSSDSASSGGGSGTWLVKSIAVSVGQNVKAGDVLATADSSSAEDSLALAQANLAVAQSKYDTDSGGTSASDREQLQIALTQAQQGVTDATSSRDDTVNQNNIKLSQARANLRQARRSGNQTAISQAQDALDLLQAQVDAENRQAKQQVETAKLQLQSAQNNFDSGTAPVDEAALPAIRRRCLQAQQAVNTAQQQVDAATLKANADGIVVAVNVVAGALAPSSDAAPAADGRDDCQRRCRRGRPAQHRAQPVGQRHGDGDRRPADRHGQRHRAVGFDGEWDERGQLRGHDRPAKRA